MILLRIKEYGGGFGDAGTGEPATRCLPKGSALLHRHRMSFISPGRAGGMEKGALMASGAQSDGGDSLFLHQIFT
ncbi:hypothetical protein [Methanovulcanius yangii]|uniref:hypothetical protein n=1 Tax=Methanovulcanius yangii TaxID=1789227 RepID=UPI0029CA62D0|nr:hypothetical protein [Methanovulcanius yangii]